MSDNKIGIILMGLVDESTKDIVNEYENNFPDAELLFCTWKSQNVEDISCKIIQIDYPSFLKKKDEYVHPHAFTINISILQAREALKCIDADIILRSRSDLFIHNKEIFNIFLKNCDDSRIMVPYIYEQEKLVVVDYFQIGYKSVLEKYWNSQEYHDDNSEYITQEEYNTSNYLKYLDEKLDDWERLKNKYFFEADWQKICKCEWTKLTLDINQQIKWKKRLYLESMKS